MKKVFLYFIAVVLGVGGILWGMVEHANERTKENIEAHRLVNIELTKRYEECQQKHPIRNKVIPPERTDCEKQVENDKPSIEAKYNYQSPEKS